MRGATLTQCWSPAVSNIPTPRPLRTGPPGLRFGDWRSPPVRAEPAFRRGSDGIDNNSALRDKRLAEEPGGGALARRRRSSPGPQEPLRRGLRSRRARPTRRPERSGRCAQSPAVRGAPPSSRRTSRGSRKPAHPRRSRTETAQGERKETAATSQERKN